jgi:hypothetical protein
LRRRLSEIRTSVIAHKCAVNLGSLPIVMPVTTGIQVRDGPEFRGLAGYRQLALKDG